MMFEEWIASLLYQDRKDLADFPSLKYLCQKAYEEGFKSAQANIKEEELIHLWKKEKGYCRD